VRLATTLANAEEHIVEVAFPVRSRTLDNRVALRGVADDVLDVFLLALPCHHLSRPGKLDLLDARPVGPEGEVRVSGVVIVLVPVDVWVDEIVVALRQADGAAVDPVVGVEGFVGDGDADFGLLGADEGNGVVAEPDSIATEN